MLVAFAQTLVLLTEGIDLSLGSQVSFATVLWILLLRMGMPIFVAIAVTIIVLMGVGAVNGLIIGKAKIPAFIATLSTQYVLYSVSLLFITAGASISFSHELFRICQRHEDPGSSAAGVDSSRNVWPDLGHAL